MTDDELDARLREAIDAEALDTTALERAVRSGLRRRPHRVWYLAAAAIAALLLLAASLRRVPAAFHEAARDHRLEVVEHRPRRWHAPSADTPTADTSTLAPAGFRLEHSKTCRIGGKAVLHLVYTDGVHQVSVYLDPAAASGDADVDGQHVMSFRTSRVRGLVVGSAAECRQFAAVIQRLT